MRNHLVLLLATLLLGAPLAGAQQAAPQPPSSIKNFLRISEQICTGGQPSMEDLAKLKADGVRAIINLRRPSEHNAEEEEAKAKQLGLRYINIPVASAEPSDSQVGEFLKVTGDAENRPAFIHCATANRVGAFWMIRRVLVDGWKVEDAEAEARKIGLHSANLVSFARDYVARHAKKPE